MIGEHDYLIQCLLEEGLLDAEGIEAARRAAAEHGMTVEEAIAASGAVSSRDLAMVRATLCECPFVDLGAYNIDIRNAELLPRSLAERHRVFPLFHFGDAVTVGMADPLNLRAIDQLRQVLKAEIDPVLCMPDALASLINRAYSLAHSNDTPDNEKDIAAESDEANLSREPIVVAVNQIINDAVAQRSSDIHISPCEHELQLRYRIDGELRSQQSPPLSAHPGIVQRLKVLAHLDLTQTRRPQDGKFRFVHAGENLEIRLSVIPTVCGENVVMRILRPHGQILDFPDLGINRDMCEQLEELITHPHGMLLVTGPTGSGKTSTLYTAIKKLNTPNRNIMTIEDPVEIRMHGIRQIQARPDVGLTFAGALRTILRQDPDVILVGEIRDEETALIATQASLTGHLVLSTLHTNDAAGAIARLKDLGVPAFVINTALLGAVAQRLVRRICTDCIRPHTPEPAILHRFKLEGDAPEFKIGAGCARCSGTGYRGRLGVYELLRVTPDIAMRIESGATTQEISRIAIAAGMRLMWQDGLDKARAGLTSLEEVARAAASIDIESEAPPLRMIA